MIANKSLVGIAMVLLSQCVREYLLIKNIDCKNKNQDQGEWVLD